MLEFSDTVVSIFLDDRADLRVRTHDGRTVSIVVRKDGERVHLILSGRPEMFKPIVEALTSLREDPNDD